MADPTAVLAASSGQQATQAALVSLMVDPIDNAFQMLDPTQPSTFDGFLLAMKALIHHFGLGSASEAARYYEAERKAAGLPGRINVPLAPTAHADKIDTSIRWATKDLWIPKPYIPSAQSLVEGVAVKNVLDTGRSTIIDAVHSDRKAKGWARETEPGCCSFCAMLAVRGAVYRSERSADFQSHDNCRCFAQPIFTSYEPSAQVRDWQSLYRESTNGVRGGKAQLNAFRRAFDAVNAPTPA